jgi:hypothetical protein
VRHPAPVDEPVVEARMSLLCGANYTRDFTVFAQAPLNDQTMTKPRPTAADRSAGTTPGSRRTPPIARPLASAGTVAASEMARATASTASTPSTPATSFQPPADPAESTDVQALARSVMRLLQTAGAKSVQASSGTLDPRHPDLEAGQRSAERQYLVQEVQRLQTESQLSASALASLHARIERAESERLLQMGWTAFTVLASILVLGIALRAADQLLPLLAQRLRRSAVATDRPSREREKQRNPIDQYLHELKQRTATLGGSTSPIDATPATTDAPMPVDTGLTFDESAGTAIATRTLEAPQVAWHPVGGQATPGRPNQWAHADFGPPTLDHRSVRLHRHEIETAIGSGYLGFALVMLEQLLHSGDGKHPWVLLRLLEVYRQLKQPVNHEGVCAEIAALYSIRVPGYDDELEAGEAPDLIARFDHWPALHAAWSSRDAEPLLASCLLRRGNGFDLDPDTFSQLLFLHEVAALRDHPQEADVPAGQATQSPDQGDTVTLQVPTAPH